MTNLSEIAREVFQAQLGEMRLHLDGCISGKDPIHLHDLRVANRRTRAALIEFKELLPQEIQQKYQQEFRWIHQTTGAVRDLDVGLSHFPEFKRKIPKSWRPHLKPLRMLMQGKRKGAQEELAQTLRSKRFSDILDTWSVLLEEGILLRSPISLEPARESGSRRILKRYQQLQIEGSKLSKNTPAEDFHQFRIQVKELRYLLEFFCPVMDQDGFERIRTELKTVQDVFGSFQDIEIQSKGLIKSAGELTETGAAADTILAIGLLLGVLEKELAREKKNSLKQTRWLISDASARAFQGCFHLPLA